MYIWPFPNNSFSENTYVLADAESNECVILDPGMSNEQEWTVVRDCISSHGLKVTGIWLTHCHVDHELGTKYVSKEYNLPVCGPIEDYEKLPTARLQALFFGIPFANSVVPVTVNINEGDKLHIGQIEVQVFDIPGHSHHGLCYYLPSEETLFTGDVLFCRSIGRSDFGPSMGCDGEALVDGIRCKLLNLPPTTIVYPGHGPTTTIADEVEQNPYF